MLTISTSNAANQNYLAKIVSLQNVRPHPKADRLQCVMVDGNNIIVGLDEKNGDVGVYFPTECQIDLDFLKKNNLLREKDLNADTTKIGFFETNGRVKCVKLRGVPSEGFWVPLDYFNYLGSRPSDFDDKINAEFDSINGTLIAKKYIPKNTKIAAEPKPAKDKKDISKKKQLLVDGQFNFHKDTPQLGKNLHQLQPNQHWSITQKIHGTSVVISKVLVKRPLKWFEKCAKWIGVNVNDVEYKNLYASRRVIKNLGAQDGSFYSQDIWGAANEIISPTLKDGMTVYAEIVGYLNNGEMIQKGFDYGCEPAKFKVYVYRVTTTSSSGAVYEWPWSHVKAWCALAGLLHVPELWSGKASDFLYSEKPEEWHDLVLERLKSQFLEKMCWLCVNKVPDEGIVLRIDDSIDLNVFKLKSFLFKEWESKSLDKGDRDIETEESCENNDNVKKN